MSLAVYLVVVALSGLIVGGLGRLLLPGPDPMSVGETILVGVAANVIAGILFYVLIGSPHGGGLVGSVLVAVGIVYVLRRVRGLGRHRGGGAGTWR